MVDLQVKRGTNSNLSTVNPTPLSGEIVYTSDANKLKIGDGVANWNSLPYLVATPDKFVRVDVNGTMSPITLGSLHHHIIAVDLRQGDVVINLPPVSSANNGIHIKIYVEVADRPYTLTVNANGTDKLRGKSSVSLINLRDSVDLYAHTFVTNHWDILNWTRTDEITYQPGDTYSTGLSTLQDLLNYTLSSGLITDFTVTPGTTTISVTASEWMLRSANTDTADCRLYSVGLATLNVPIGTSYLTVNHPVMGGDTQPYYAIETNPNNISCNAVSIASILYREGNTINYIKLGSHATNFFTKFAKKQSETSWLEYGDGLILGELANRGFSLSAGSLYSGVTRIGVNALSSAVDNFTYYRRNGTTGNWITLTNQTQINNTQYDLNGVLTTLGSNRFGVHWVYLLTNNPSRLAVVFGQAQYTNLAAAQAAGVPSALPAFAYKYSIGKLVGKIIIVRNGTSFSGIQSTFLTQFSNSTPTNHNDLGNRDVAGAHSSFIPATDSTTAFTFRKANGTTLVAIDTVGELMQIGANTVLTSGSTLDGGVIE